MRPSLIRTLAILCCVALILAGAAQPTRLIVDNRTNTPAQVQVWRYNGDHWDWWSVGPVNPGNWIPVTNVRNGDNFRVLGPSITPPIHVVQLYPDRAYGGYQDIWLLR